ncbi:MAG: hypothetical protein EKK48_23290 [Candidatus Melainabacteria bacterium]|nr:MAG: hypothetical protein EKK48_23290 [Candidatus Melainabacteria bacterium]
MKKRTNFCIGIFALLCSAQSVQAGFHAAPGGSILMAVGRLEPWFIAVDKKLENRINSLKIVRTVQHESLICSFDIQRDGSIRNLNIERSSGLENLDASVLAVLKEISFARCPNNVPVRRGVFCDVSVIDGYAQVFTHLNPNNREMYFPVEYYSKKRPPYNLRIGIAIPRQ